MRDPKILLSRLWVIFDLICFLLALYMTLKMIGRFREDKSTTSVAYKKHAATLEDQYPTFSLCLKGDDLYRFDSNNISKAYGIYSNQYQMLLKGNTVLRYGYNAKKLIHNTFHI